MNTLDWQSGIGYPARKLNLQVFLPNLRGLVIKYGRLSIQRGNVWSGKLPPRQRARHLIQLEARLIAQRNTPLRYLQAKVQQKDRLGKSRDYHE